MADAAPRHARLRRRGRFAAFLVAARRLRARAEASPADRAHGGSRPARRGRASADRVIGNPASPDARASSQPAANEPVRLARTPQGALPVAAPEATTVVRSSGLTAANF